MPSRQTDKNQTTTLVYKYGLVPHGYLKEEAIDALYKANQLWNRLVELHHENWQKLEQARCTAYSAYAGLKTQIEKLEEDIIHAYDAKRKLRVGSGSMSGSDPKIKLANQKIDELKDQRKKIWVDLKKERLNADKLIDKKAIEDERRKEFNKAVRVDQSGIYSSTSNEVGRDFANARERILQKPVTIVKK